MSEFKTRAYQHLPKNKEHVHLLSDPILFKQLSEKIAMEKQFNNNIPMCVAASSEYLLVGNSIGELLIYDRQTQEPRDYFIEKGKDFQNNAITAIAVHPNKQNYVLLGYSNGQIVLLDLNDLKKSLKVIKDHHRSVKIENLAFCETDTKANEPKQEPSKPI